MLALEVAYPKPTETLYSYTVLVLIHTCVTKVYSLCLHNVWIAQGYWGSAHL